MEYDNYGNITKKNGKAYTYGDAKWKDLLTGFDGKTIEYDAQGNPVKYLGHTLTWEKGRQLKKFDNIEYTYNANGIRTSKKMNGVLHTYTLDGTKILRETWGGNALVPLYDNEDSVCGILYNNIPYYFIKNLQGDVIAIVDQDAKTVARYSYDAWGVCTVTQDSVGIATVNPFRYRSYYFDEEIGLYYLQSRYYNAGVGRFINVDSIDFVINRAQYSICCDNLYSYCANNSIMNTDPSGAAGITIAIIVIALLLAGVVGGIIKVKALQDTESYKNTIGGGQFLQSAITFLLGFFQVIYTIFFMALLSCWIISLACAVGNAIKEFIKCKKRLKASVFAAFIDGLTDGLITHVIGKIIKVAIKSKNLRTFVETIINELR